MAGSALPLTRASVHVAVDMQELFASHPDWGIATASSIVDAVGALASHGKARTLWTRFIPARNAASAKGCWRDYFERWPRATLDRGVDVEILPALRGLAAPGTVFDKSGYSAFENPAFAEHLRAMQADALILSGAETDICILSTALGAIDLGYFVVLATDAMTSHDLAAHKATLEIVMPRYAPQIRLARVTEILAAWR